MKKFRILAGALVTGVALALLAPIAPAQAASCSFTPKSVTLYDKTKNVTFDVPGARTWQVQIRPLSLYPWEDSEHSQAVVQMDAAWYRNSNAGKLKARVVKNGEGCDATFQLLRGTRLGLKVKAVAGGKRTVQGTLERMNFGQDYYHSYVDYRAQKVRIEYRSTVSGKWVSAGTITTKKDGSFKLTRKIGKRQWRAVYGGSASSGSRVSAIRKG